MFYISVLVVWSLTERVNFGSLLYDVCDFSNVYPLYCIAKIKFERSLGNIRILWYLFTSYWLISNHFILLSLRIIYTYIYIYLVHHMCCVIMHTWHDRLHYECCITSKRHLSLRSIWWWRRNNPTSIIAGLWFVLKQFLISWRMHVVDPFIITDIFHLI